MTEDIKQQLYNYKKFLKSDSDVSSYRETRRRLLRFIKDNEEAFVDLIKEDKEFINLLFKEFPKIIYSMLGIDVFNYIELNSINLLVDKLDDEEVEDLIKVLIDNDKYDVLDYIDYTVLNSFLGFSDNISKEYLTKLKRIPKSLINEEYLKRLISLEKFNNLIEFSQFFYKLSSEEVNKIFQHKSEIKGIYQSQEFFSLVFKYKFYEEIYNFDRNIEIDKYFNKYIADYYEETKDSKIFKHFYNWDEERLFNGLSNFDTIELFISNVLDNRIPYSVVSDEYLRDKFKNSKNLYPQFLYKNNSLQELADLLNIDINVLMNKYNYLKSKNVDIDLTLIPIMLTDKFDVFSLDELSILTLYPKIENIMGTLNSSELVIVKSILSIVKDLDIDYSEIFYRCLKNIKNYEFLYSKDLTVEQLKNLIYISQRKDNFYQINNPEELKDAVFEEKKKKLFAAYLDLIESNSIDIINLKQALFEKKYGLGLTDAKFIIYRYCSEENMLENVNLPEQYKNFLRTFYDLYNSMDLELLKEAYVNSLRVKSDLFQLINIESILRSQYAEEYKSSLVQVSDLANMSKYKNDYILLDGDFNMQVHALGAYSLYNKPDNFRDDWLRPLMKSHGVCTSLIANDEIATARAFHPILGFTEYSNKALLLSAPYDIVSNTANTMFNTSSMKVSKFFTSKELIDNTRYTHNEIVIERKNENGEEISKIVPSYLVYVVDDVSNEYNFMTLDEALISLKNEGVTILPEHISTIKGYKDVRNTIDYLSDKYSTDTIYKIKCAVLNEEYLQAKKDFDIPIVVIDRLKYVKEETDKQIDLLNEFKKSKDAAVLKRLIVETCNNMFSTHNYSIGNEFNPIHEYYNYFSEDKLKILLEEISLIVAENPGLKKEFSDILHDEKRKFIFESEFKFITDCFNPYLVEANEKQINISVELNDLYLKSDDDVQRQIDDAINNGMSIEDIYYQFSSNKTL